MEFVKMVSELPKLIAVWFTTVTLQFFIFPLIQIVQTHFLLIVVLLLGTFFALRARLGPASSKLNPEDYLKDVRLGRWTAQPGLAENGGDGEEKGSKKLSKEGIVCFILAASSNQYVFSSSLCPGIFDRFKIGGFLASRFGRRAGSLE